MSSENDFLKVFEPIFERIVGLDLWAVTGGGATGSHIKLSIGEKIKRIKPVNNNKLASIQRNIQGEFSILIFCSWALIDSANTISHSSEIVVMNQYPYFSCLTLDSAIITKITSKNGALVLHFNNKYKLHILCDESEYDNFLFFDEYNKTVFSLNGELQMEAETFARS
jgi:hypothetical protein